MSEPNDKYLTFSSDQSGFFRDRGSKFYAYAFPMDEPGEFDEKLAEIRKQHPKARHFCFAWRLDPEEQEFRYSDDGEPGGSAGLPIFNQLKSHELFHAAIVVVRYFGGKKLGVPGLINAYKQAAAEAILETEPVVTYITREYRLRFNFEQTGAIMRALNESEAAIIFNGFDEGPLIRYRIRLSSDEALKIRLLSLLLKRDISEVRGDEQVEGF